jgi:ABC-2 type transport system ATP-binding protein
MINLMPNVNSNNDPTDPKIKWAIDVKDLSKSFAGKVAVKNLSLQIKKGEIFGFLGPNGGGKTTTIRMLCGLLTPDSGQGTCLGYDILTQSHALKEHIGYMTQNFSLYTDLSIEENLDFMARVYSVPDRQQRVEDTLKRLKLLQRRTQLVQNLSGGWKQRLALAAALLHDPQLLLLDEPTAGVDPKARRDFWDTIHQLSDEGITTLVSTHYMDEADRCNRVGYISFGELIAFGTAEEVIEKEGLTTWSVSGDQLSHLAKELANLPGIEQVIAYGSKLHVSGHDSGLMEKSIATYQTNDQYTWTLTPSNLEDVFIHLVGKTDNPEA